MKKEMIMDEIFTFNVIVDILKENEDFKHMIIKEC